VMFNPRLPLQERVDAAKVVYLRYGQTGRDIAYNWLEAQQLASESSTWSQITQHPWSSWVAGPAEPKWIGGALIVVGGGGLVCAALSAGCAVALGAGGAAEGPAAERLTETSSSVAAQTESLGAGSRVATSVVADAENVGAGTRFATQTPANLAQQLALEEARSGGAFSTQIVSPNKLRVGSELAARFGGTWELRAAQAIHDPGQWFQVHFYQQIGTDLQVGYHFVPQAGYSGA
jgi:hypothetical protein